MLHFPFLLGAMSIFHNIPGVEKSGKAALNMTACVLAKVFRREITTWDDPEITSLNPGLSVPENQDIKVYHRKFGSSTTHGITTYLHTACPAHYEAEYAGKLVEWPEDTYDAEGSGEMAEYLSSVEYSIGYIDSGHGHGKNLAEIELQNNDGLFQSSLEAIPRGGVALAASEALANGIVPQNAMDSFADVSLHNMPGDVTWPIVALSYIYVDMNVTSAGETGVLLKAFLEYIISDEGQELVEEYGFIGVPEAIKNVALNALATMVVSTDTPWTFESSTTLKGTGMKPYVISGKRRSWTEYAISSNADTLSAHSALLDSTEPLSSLVSENERLLTLIEAQTAAYESLKKTQKDTDGDFKRANAMALAGLLIGLLALLLHLLMFFVNKKDKL